MTTLYARVAEVARQSLAPLARGRHVVVWGAAASGRAVWSALEESAPASLSVTDSSPAARAAWTWGGVREPSSLADLDDPLVVVATLSPASAEAIAGTCRALCGPGVDVRALPDVLAESESALAGPGCIGVDRPRPGQRTGRRVEVTGWAVARHGVNGVWIDLPDGTSVRAFHGLPRPDVAPLFAGGPGAERAGVVAAGPPAARVRVVAGTPDGVVGPTDVTLGAPGVARRPRHRCPACEGTALLPLSRLAWFDYALCRCASCGCLTTLDDVADEDCRAFYNDPAVYDAQAHDGEAARRSPEHPDAETMASLIRAALGAGSRRRPAVLEIGCGTGRLINGLRARGFDVAGLEISRRAADVARDLFGLTVTTDDPLTAAIDRAPDAVIMRHVIEHLARPFDVVQRVASWVAAGGVLVVVTPNAASLAARALGPAWEWCMPPLHVHGFTAAALSGMVARAGFGPQALFTRQGDAQALPAQLRLWRDVRLARGDSAEARRLEWLAHACEAFERRRKLDERGRGEELVGVFVRGGDEH